MAKVISGFLDDALETEVGVAGQALGGMAVVDAIGNLVEDDGFDFVGQAAVTESGIE